MSLIEYNIHCQECTLRIKLYYLFFNYIIKSCGLKSANIRHLQADYAHKSVYTIAKSSTEISVFSQYFCLFDFKKKCFGKFKKR